LEGICAAGGYMGGFLLSPPAAAVAGRKTWLFLWPSEIQQAKMSVTKLTNQGSEKKYIRSLSGGRLNFNHKTWR
jgi:hypothetical protein